MNDQTTSTLKLTLALAAMLVSAIIPDQSVQAQTVTTLHSFDNADGANPAAGLIQATDGNLYGTTYQGGANDQGTVFKVTPAGTLTPLYSFCSQVNGAGYCADGANPQEGLVQATNGNFYGTTYLGGASNNGTIFQITPDGTLTTLYSFCALCTGGELEYPEGGLMQASNGDIYGTTAHFAPHDSYGTIFKMTLGGNPTTLHTFHNSYPPGTLLQAVDGALYGTTIGFSTGRPGTVFRISLGGKVTTIYDFCSQSLCSDGYWPVAALIQATNGDLYGTTQLGGLYPDGTGTVFQVTTSGALTTLYDFCYLGGSCPNGEAPEKALIQATDGNLYGTTYSGGNGGTIFQVIPGGTLTTLYSFCAQANCADGEGPDAGLVQATNGMLYGTTYLGGANGYGSIFSLSIGLGPFVALQPSMGKVGVRVTILGTELTGATSVMFNGTAAKFTAISASEITATVPKGATTGKVTVTTSGGVLSSNLAFTVVDGR